MDCSDEVFISKLEIKEEPLYIKILWINNSVDLFHIQLLDDKFSWSGKYSLEAAKKYADIVDENETAYQTNVKRCLQNCSTEYVFDFATSSLDPASFCWKKKFEGSTAVLVHGKVLLYKDGVIEPKNTLIDTLIDKNYKLTQKILRCKEENEKLSIELEKCKKELETFAEMKISLESSLYSKFLQLLNTKKRRIQLLEDLLQENEKC
ncbi:unnamed protein product [Leptosia nina]|uniref:DNA repair protein XRCC4 n=1 Tax=Leptosia nina TaxID=320188 RepID=A0AAV1JS51_9NEOP